MRLILSFLACFPCVLSAEEWAVLERDAVLNRDEAVQATEGQVLTYYDNGQSSYAAGGAYSYTYDGGGTAFGTFTIDEAGVICVSFRNGRSRCDKLVRNDGRLILLTEKGERFPVRP